MTIRYRKYKNGIEHNIWLFNVSNIEIIYEYYDMRKIPTGLDVTIKSGSLIDEYNEDGIEHTTKTNINSLQHFILSKRETRKHLHLYL